MALRQLPHPPSCRSLKEMAAELGVPLGSLMSSVAMSRTKPPVRFYSGKNMTRPYYDREGFLAWFASGGPRRWNLQTGEQTTPKDSVSRGDLALELGMTARKLKALIEAAQIKPRVAFYDKRDHTRPRFSRAEFMAWWSEHGGGKAFNGKVEADSRGFMREVAPRTNG